MARLVESKFHIFKNILTVKEDIQTLKTIVNDNRFLLNISQENVHMPTN